MRIHKIYIILYISFLFMGCKEKRVSINNDRDKSVRDSIAIVGDSIPEGWKIYNNENIRLNIPNDWKAKEISNSLFYASTNKEKNTYYAILYHEALNISLEEYLKEAFKQVSEKDNEFSYFINKIRFSNKDSCYVVDFFIEENSVKYKVYTLLYKFKDHVIDFSYKTINEESLNPYNYQTFYNIIFSFKLDGTKVINRNQFIVEDSELISYEQLIDDSN